MLREFDHWLFEEYRVDLESLAIFRILFGAHLLLSELPSGLWIRALPPGSFCPPMGFAAFFVHYPPYWVVFVANAVALACACALILGWHTAVASVGVGVGLLTVETCSFADGKIDHSILLIVTALVLARSGWGLVWSLDARRDPTAAQQPGRNRSWLLSVLGLSVGLAIFSAGFAKARGGWLDPGTRATRWHLLPNYYVVGRKEPVALWAMQHVPGWAWKLMDYATVAWEVGLVFTVPRRKLFRAGCAFGALFHFGVWQLFSIQFDDNVIVYGAFLGWASVWPANRPRVRAVLSSLSSRTTLALCIAPFALAACALFAFGTDLSDRFSLPLSQAVLGGGLIVGLWYLGKLVGDAASWLTTR
jgi:hypothetical protein